MRKRILPYMLVLATGIGVGIALSSSSNDGERSQASAVTAPLAEVDHHPDMHEGHVEERRSDLDRPIEELLSATCEHGMKTWECDACRYEIGVVKAPDRLFAEGLLHTETVTEHVVAAPFTTTGEVRFDERRVAHVGSQVEGIIREVYVSLGDKVRKGQALLEIESVAIGEAEADYLEAMAILRLTESNHEREAELRRKGLAAERDYLQSKQELEKAEIHAASALAKLTRLGMSETNVRELTTESAKGRVVLRAPLDGTVLSLHALSGEVVEATEDLATIGDNSSVWVWADLYERDIARVTRRQGSGRLAAVVSTQTYPGEEFPGTVDFISPVMAEVSRTVKLRVDVENPDGRLLDGMFVDVCILLPGNDRVMALSNDAILEDEGRPFVFVHLRDDYYVRRPVATGRCWADRVEITEGLSGGETVVAEGSFLMKSDVLRSKMGAGCAD